VVVVLEEVVLVGLIRWTRDWGSGSWASIGGGGRARSVARDRDVEIAEVGAGRGARVTPARRRPGGDRKGFGARWFRVLMSGAPDEERRGRRWQAKGVLSRGRASLGVPRARRPTRSFELTGIRVMAVSLAAWC
jgi:hypothetical protein